VGQKFDFFIKINTGCGKLSGFSPS